MSKLLTSHYMILKRYSNILTRHYEHVSVLVSVICPMTGSTVTDSEARSLVANQLKTIVVFAVKLETPLRWPLSFLNSDRKVAQYIPFLEFSSA